MSAFTTIVSKLADQQGLGKMNTPLIKRPLFSTSKQLTNRIIILSLMAGVGVLTLVIVGIFLGSQQIQRQFEPPFAGAITILYLFAGLVVIGAAAFIYQTIYFVQNHILSPLAELTEMAGQILAKDLEKKAQVAGKNEFEYIEKTFQAQAMQLQELRQHHEQEIAAFQQAEKVTQESDERYRQLFDVGPDALLFADTETLELLDANSVAVDQYGYTHEEFLNLLASDLSNEPEATTLFLRRGNAHTPLRYHRRKDGTVFPVEIKAVTFVWQGRRVQFAAIRDITRRIQVKEALHKSEARYRGLFEHAPISLWEEDFSEIKQEIDRLRANGISDFRAYFAEHPEVVTQFLDLIKVIDVNQAAIKLYQGTDKQTMRTISDVVIPGNVNAIFSEALAFFIEGRTTFWSESSQLSLTGDTIHVIGCTIIMPGFEDTWSRVVVSSIDITERKWAERALEESEERYRRAQQIGHVGNWEYNIQTTEFWGSDEAKRIYGFDPIVDTFLTEHVESCIPERERVHQALIDLIETGQEYDLEFDILTFDKQERRTVFSMAELEKDENGIPWKVAGVIQDITNRKLAETALRQSEENLRITLNSIGDAVISTNTDGDITRMNLVAEALTGWKRTEAIGQSLTAVFHIINKDTREPVENPVEKVLKTGDVVGLVNHALLVAKDGSEYQIAESGAPIRDANDNIRGVVLVFRDVTEQLLTEKELLKVKKLESVGMLAGGIAHDFNNLLTGLFGNLELAKIFLSPEHKSYKYLESAWRSLDGATNLTKQLLTFAKGGDPIKEALSIGEVISETAHFSIRGSRAKLQADIAVDLWLVNADKGQLSQVISNLVINAEQSMPTGGLITIAAQNVETAEGKFVQISVQDEGVGIAPQYLEKVFDPYFTTKQDGSGLGLASTHSIVVKHNGRITVDSILDQGTTFVVHLPAVQQPESSAATKSTLENAKSIIASARILVMDDEEMVRNVIEAMLLEMGIEGEFVVEGKEAIAAYRDSLENGNPYDIVITDLTIPGGMGGQETAQEILKINPEASLVATSGYATDPVLSHYQDYGYKGIAVKPFRYEDLQNVIVRVLEL